MESEVLALSALSAGPASPSPPLIGTRSVPTTTKVRASPERRVWNEIPLVTSVDLAMSHALTNFAVPSGSNWTEQVAGLVSTKIGVDCSAATSSGLAAAAIQCEAGK